MSFSFKIEINLLGKEEKGLKWRGERGEEIKSTNYDDCFETVIVG
jgi:hypothetical protein